MRIFRTCRVMNISTVAVYTHVDRGALHVRYAEEAYCISESPEDTSYLKPELILSIAKKTGAAIHPGYGFLSENADFARRCEEEGVIFIGPGADIIAKMGIKTEARKIMREAGLPIVPGTEAPVQGIEEVKKVAKEVGYPIMLKALAGGGGKGMRLVRSEEEVEAALRLSQSEAGTSFGNDAVYIEKYIENPHHIEVQIMGDKYGNVVHLGERFSEVSDPAPLPDGRFAITAQAGASLQKLSKAAADHSLTGLEFAAGIPGTVGGAAYMNAGAYGGELKDVVTLVTAMEQSGKTVAYTPAELQMSYRHSRFSDEAVPSAILSVTVALHPGDLETIRATIREFAARRREKQPLSVPGCGSTFKRPEGQFAGTLIDNAGLKGLRIGGASVSTLHAGFLVNDENGTAADYLALIAAVQKAVQEDSGVWLEPEVRILGEDAPVSLL